MVDFDVVKERLLKGAYVGVGSFASSYASTLIENKLQLGEFGTAGTQLGTGLAVSVGVDEVFSNRSSMPNDAIEYAGYGIQGAAWSEMAELMVPQQTGATMSARQTGQNTEVVELDEQAGEAESFQADVA